MRTLGLKKKSKIIIVISVALIVLGVNAFDVRYKTVNYNLYTDKVQQDIKIAVVADLHSCDYGKNQKRLIDSIDKEEADIVVLCGDIIDDRLPQKKAKEFLASISEKYPCYYVSGNHEYWSGRVVQMKKMIRDYGITVLEGEYRELMINEQKIILYGIDDPEVGSIEFNKQLEQCGGAVEKETYSVLLSHRPERIEQYSTYDFDLVLSGHAHGGQWRIPLLLNGLLAPDQGMFPKYAGGKYQVGDTTMVVSRGLARETTRVPRLFNRPELVMVNLKNK